MPVTQLRICSIVDDKRPSRIQGERVKGGQDK